MAAATTTAAAEAAAAARRWRPEITYDRLRVTTATRSCSCYGNFAKYRSFLKNNVTSFSF